MHLAAEQLQRINWPLKALFDGGLQQALLGTTKLRCRCRLLGLRLRPKYSSKPAGLQSILSNLSNFARMAARTPATAMLLSGSISSRQFVDVMKMHDMLVRGNGLAFGLVLNKARICI